MKRRSSFTNDLLDWYEPTERPLPWKHIKNAYLIWLSEVILQQTRVEQGRSYFEKFKEKYPKVQDLAAAASDEVMKLWEGLGYYSRARNMHAAAKTIVEKHGGQFPEKHKDILALKGVGPYTAAAIASFAYGLPHAVVDGNVFRVLSRVFDIDTGIDTTAGKHLFNKLAANHLDETNPGIYNQAIMDFGATVCTPKKPACAACPMQSHCLAYQNDTISLRPVKIKKLKRTTRHFNYLVLKHEDSTFIQQRIAKDIWQQLYQFPLLESEGEITEFQDLKKITDWPIGLTNSSFLHKKGPYKQDLSHQRIYGTFWEVAIDKQIFEKMTAPFLPTEHKNLRKFAFPKIIDWYLNDKALYLF